MRIINGALPCLKTRVRHSVTGYRLTPQSESPNIGLYVLYALYCLQEGLYGSCFFLYFSFFMV